MGMPGGFELLAILLIVVLIFGGKKIPELMKGIGSGIKNFKNAVKEDEVEKPEVANKTTTTTEKKAEEPNKA
jgi:sec-independent protein translocase protein TatA